MRTELPPNRSHDLFKYRWTLKEKLELNPVLFAVMYWTALGLVPYSTTFKATRFRINPLPRMKCPILDLFRW